MNENTETKNDKITLTNQIVTLLHVAKLSPEIIRQASTMIVRALDIYDETEMEIIENAAAKFLDIGRTNLTALAVLFFLRIDRHRIEASSQWYNEIPKTAVDLLSNYWNGGNKSSIVIDAEIAWQLASTEACKSDRRENDLSTISKQIVRLTNHELFIDLETRNKKERLSQKEIIAVIESQFNDDEIAWQNFNDYLEQLSSSISKLHFTDDLWGIVKKQLQKLGRKQEGEEIPF